MHEIPRMQGSPTEDRPGFGRNQLVPGSLRQRDLRYTKHLIWTYFVQLCHINLYNTLTNHAFLLHFRQAGKPKKEQEKP